MGIALTDQGMATVPVKETPGPSVLELCEKELLDLDLPSDVQDKCSNVSCTVGSSRSGRGALALVNAVGPNSAKLCMAAEQPDVGSGIEGVPTMASPRAAQRHGIMDSKVPDPRKMLATRIDGPLGKPGARIQVELDTGWADWGESEMRQSLRHYLAGWKKFPMEIEGEMYIVDLSDVGAATQTKARTQKTQKLRVIHP